MVFVEKATAKQRCLVTKLNRSGIGGNEWFRGTRRLSIERRRDVTRGKKEQTLRPERTVKKVQGCLNQADVTNGGHKLLKVRRGEKSTSTTVPLSDRGETISHTN